ncbi:MFS transporter [Actinoplanes sp. NPDC051411]|uniref:MFS transporter n=1 Tax=Actinoplanes sp. NPDC051411 TaxID=3155522 RepID=UPI0034417548
MNDFRKLWTGDLISQFGDRVSELALPLIAVATLAASPAQVGLLTAAVWAPNLLGVLAGAWVDRRPHRRSIMIGADLLRAAALFSLPIAHWFGVITLTQLFAVALLSGAGQVLSMAAYQSFFVTLVPPSRYVEANSKLNISRSASFSAGPAIGGYLIQLLTAPVAVIVDAFSFLASALFLSRIPSSSTPVHASAGGVRHGVRYVFEHPYLRAALACVTTLNFFTFIAQALAVLFASRTLGLPAGVIGLAFGLGALGGLAGAAVAPRLAQRYGVGRLVLLGSILFPAPIAIMALATGPHWLEATIIAAGEALSAAGVMIFDINLNSIQTAVTADHMRSRVSGVFSTINYGSRPLGAVIGGLLGSWIGVRPTLLLAAAGGALCCLWLFPSPIPRIRSLSEVGSPPVLVHNEA